MNKLSKILIPMVVLAALLISACAGAAAPTDNSGGGKVEAAPVEFTGVIEAIDGNQWTVNGQVITVNPSVLRDGPFIVGDTVKVEAQVQQDGSLLVIRVEVPGVSDNSNDANANDANSNGDNSNGDNSNGDNSNGDNSNGDNANDGGLTIDGSNSEAFGTVDSISTETVVIGGQTFTITNGAEFKDQIQAGDFVKVHFLLNADGTMTLLEIESWDPALISNANEANGNDSNSNDDSGYDDNSNNNNGNDDNGGDSNENDDKGGGNENGGGGNDNGG